MKPEDEAWRARLIGHADDSLADTQPAEEVDPAAGYRVSSFLWSLLALVVGVGGFVVLCLVLAGRAQAAEVGLHLVTFHNGSTMPGQDGRPVRLRTFTPGLYVLADSGWGAGGFLNSFGDPVGWAGFVPSLRLSPRLEASLKLGAIAGYRHDSLMPAAIPSLRVTVHGEHAVRFAYLARKPGEPHGVDAVHVLYVRRL